MKKLHLVEHPFVVDSLSHLRDQRTSLEKFREYSDRICSFLFAEAVAGLTFRKEQISTPLAKINVAKINDEIIIIPVLRSGIAMLFGAMKLLPRIKVGFVGMERNEETAVAREYYWKLPKITSNSVVIITDPMLATGGSIAHLINKVIKEKPKAIRIVSVVAAPEGIDRLKKEFPRLDLEIFVAAVDEQLNNKKYIVPGLGDYGDRYFGT
ncbi:MAG: uracil phosphoribosyltransferase [Patescibacteria group bacterium]